MIDTPFWLRSLFYVSTIMCFFFLFKAIAQGNPENDSKKKKALYFLYAVTFILLVPSAVLASQEFFIQYDAQPPRLIFGLAPALIIISACFLFFTKQLRQLSIKHLILLHSCRLVVEFGLYGLASHKLIPIEMTFEGNNWDILMGITAPIVYWFYCVKKQMPRDIFLAWNFIGLFMLTNIVSNGIISTPYFGGKEMETPNIAVLYYPFIWLPAFIVPSVFFAHVVSIFNTFKDKQDGPDSE